ncbi:serine/threonine-protein kinase [Aeromicrobium sp. A1-2]|uniref:serine/threonine-protein kinase n=1 Tax=Aeromicrobium sp. A1-2 TaxID=2107713 RepID=UPI0013C2BC49|nr:serine/threonine-protein kinase [Aeromicrobium sp. A1-2]
MDAGNGNLPAGYEFNRVLGAGGFGEVVLARHVRLNRLVAIKHIHGYYLNDEESLKRFEREAKLLARTSSPSVVRVYDLCRTEGNVHLVMEYAPGRPLSEILESGPMPAAEAIVVLRDVADALAAAARHGIVHRDVKPANVFVLPDGRAKLGDFGIARMANDPSIFRTAEGPAMGTPAYFPPELGQGLSEPDERSDAYSFAVMAFEMLTGARPFEGPDALSLITAHWRLEVPDPGSILSGFPVAATAILRVGLEKDPSSRSSPAELVLGLAGIRADRWPAVDTAQRARAPVGASDPTIRGAKPPGSAEAPPVLAAGRRPRRRLKMLLAGLAAAGVAITLAVLAMTSIGRSAPLVVEAVDLTVDPRSGESLCPAGAFTFDGSIRTNGEGGSVTFAWVRPDGKDVPAHTVAVEDGQRRLPVQLSFTVSGSQAFEGVAMLRVLEPGALSAEQKIRYTCPAS